MIFQSLSLQSAAGWASRAERFVRIGPDREPARRRSGRRRGRAGQRLGSTSEVQVYLILHIYVLGSFSAVSTPILTSKYSFFSIFSISTRCRFFCTAPIAAISQIFVKICAGFRLLEQFLQFLRLFIDCSPFFEQVLMKFAQNFTIF